MVDNGSHNQVPTFSLRRRLISRMGVLFLLASMLVLAVDGVVVHHVKSHQGGQDQPSHSMSWELLHTVPLLLIPHLIILLVMFVWLYRSLTRELFVPLISLSTRFASLKTGQPLPLQLTDPIPEEVGVLFETYQAAFKHVQPRVTDKQEELTLQ